MVSDRVGDFIIRLKNAGAVKHDAIELPYSAYIESIAKKLRKLGFVGDIEKKDDRTLRVALVYNEDGSAHIRDVKRISKPGRRLYISHLEAHVVAGGTGARIISTPKGILSDSEARRERVGGENLFEIW
ncbi:SSU ribosomal protein S8p (S15Ae) [hydrothermal vent metagenome]|uniref:SSU ribosomal protein S8p (S15Ae) n=1 Tax=hydrothermal vent metagenome TaxID=652676 RepID=A0A3B0UUA5_9ZZZZ